MAFWWPCNAWAAATRPAGLCKGFHRVFREVESDSIGISGFTGVPECRGTSNKKGLRTLVKVTRPQGNGCRFSGCRVVILWLAA